VTINERDYISFTDMVRNEEDGLAVSELCVLYSKENNKYLGNT